MEKQKIFWVILSVTVFVVVVLVVGLFLLKQSPDGLAVVPARTEPSATAKPAGTPPASTSSAAMPRRPKATPRCCAS